MGRIEVTRRRGRRRKQLLDYLKEKARYCRFKEEALDRTLWRTRFGRGFGPVVRQTEECIKYAHSVVTYEFILKMIFPQISLHLPLSALNTAYCGNCALYLDSRKFPTKTGFRFNPEFV